jgi:hypothetical protein
MPPSPRYTVRLPHALDALVQARVRAGTPFAVLIRAALAAYLADTPPTEAPTAADSADILHDIQGHLAALTARVDILELALTTVPTPRPQPADTGADRTPTRAPIPADTSADTAPTATDRNADRPPTGADSPAAAPEVVLWSGLHKLTPRQVDELRAKRARGAPIKALMQEYGLSRATVHRYLAALPGA